MTATRVAILDDDQSVRVAIERLLKTSGITVMSYATSIDLFNALRIAHPDCLLLDFQMPGMNGLEVMQYLAASGISVPTIVITAHDEPGSRASCFGAGAKAFLRKPLDAGELIQAIQDATAL